MKKHLNELEKQIAEKNAALETLKKNPGYCREDMQRLNTELDQLLYSYYKSVGCNCRSTVVLWSAAV